MQGREEAARAKHTVLPKERGFFPALGFPSAMEILLLYRVDYDLLHLLSASLSFAQVKVRRGQLPSTADNDKASLRVTSPSW